MSASAPQPQEARLGRFVDPKALMNIQHLEWRARLVVEGFRSGLHRSPYHGFSVEFTEYRQYTVGDDPRSIDWRVFARSDRYYIKRFQDETNLRCHLLVDQSRSMAYGSLTYTKADYAATLAATLAQFLHLQGDAVGLFTFDEQVREYLPARHRPGHLRPLMHALDREAAGRSTDLAAPLRRAAEIIRKRGLLIILSDFLAGSEGLGALLGSLAAAGHELVVIQIMDPTEVAFPFVDPAQFEDLETGRTLLLDPETVRKGYQNRLSAHTEQLRATCLDLGAAWTRWTTDQPLELALLNFLRSRRNAGSGGRLHRSNLR
jgi:uncharacterized protein (DUF58 family)